MVTSALSSIWNVSLQADGTTITETVTPVCNQNYKAEASFAMAVLWTLLHQCGSERHSGTSN